MNFKQQDHKPKTVVAQVAAHCWAVSVLHDRASVFNTSPTQRFVSEQSDHLITSSNRS